MFTEKGSGTTTPPPPMRLVIVDDAPVRVVVDVHPSRAAVAEPVAGERPDQAAHSACPHLLAQCRPVYVQPVTVLHGNGLDGREEEGGRIVGVRPIG